LIIFIGAQAKGLTAAVVPIWRWLRLIAAAFGARNSLAHLAALWPAPSLCIPFMLAEAPASGAAGDTGLLLVFAKTWCVILRRSITTNRSICISRGLQVLWFRGCHLMGGIAAIFIITNRIMPRCAG